MSVTSRYQLDELQGQARIKAGAGRCGNRDSEGASHLQPGWWHWAQPTQFSIVRSG
jgi:hypothetical protein